MLSQSHVKLFDRGKMIFHISFIHFLFATEICLPTPLMFTIPHKLSNRAVDGRGKWEMAEEEGPLAKNHIPVSQ